MKAHPDDTRLSVASNGVRLSEYGFALATFLEIMRRRQTVFFLVAAILLSLCVPLALSIELGAFPDELVHLGYVLDVSRDGFPDYRYGTEFGTTLPNYLNHPPLYYLLAGLEAVALDLSNPSSQAAVRMLNIFISLATLWLVFRILLDLGVKASGIAFGLLLWTSIPMIPALGASINNDTLSFFGGTLFIWGLVRWHPDRAWSIDLMVLGAGIAALTKATAALGVVVLVVSYVSVNRRDIVPRVSRLRGADWAKIVLLLAIVAAFYGTMIVVYGEPFPRPGNGPEEAFALAHPDAARRTIVQQLETFFSLNKMTLLQTYGHQPFEDAWYRPLVLGWLLTCAGALAGISLTGGAEEPARVRRLMLSFWIALGLYLVIYFVLTYRLHLATGYPGAIQARYVFPLLSLLIAASCIGFSRLHRLWPLQGLLVLLAALAVSGLYVTAWTTSKDPEPIFAVSKNVETDVSSLGLETVPVDAGYVDLVEWKAGRLEIVGWAIDKASRRAAAAVIVFLEDRFVGFAKPDRRLPELAEKGLVLKGENAGFGLILAISPWDAATVCDIDIYAIQDDGRAAALPINPCLHRRRQSRE